MTKKISQAVIRRLPRYYRYLCTLEENQIEHISSYDLSKRMNVTASQIRQDLNNFGGFGMQGYGYNVQYLKEEIGKILGLDRVHNIVLIGAGHMCHALANYKAVEKRGFCFIAAFDNNPDIIGNTLGDLTIMDIRQLPEFVRTHDVEIGAITVPKENAQKIADILVENKIKAIWNFAHVDLKVPQGVVVENVHLSESLMWLSYHSFNQE